MGRLQTQTAQSQKVLHQTTTKLIEDKKFFANQELFSLESLKNQTILWLEGKHKLEIALKNPRKNRLGDYSFDSITKKHRITLNSNLEELARFFVLTHEMAHFFAYQKFGRKILPHGKEWKLVFANLLLETMDLYPENWQNALLNHCKKPFANILHDNSLSNLLLPNLYSDKFQLSNLSVEDVFVLKEKKFKVINKNRKRYLCLCIDDQRNYWVHQNSWIDRT